MLASSNPFYWTVCYSFYRGNEMFRGEEKVKKDSLLWGPVAEAAILKKCAFKKSLTEPILKCGSRADDTANGKRIKSFRRLLREQTDLLRSKPRSKTFTAQWRRWNIIHGDFTKQVRHEWARALLSPGSPPTAVWDLDLFSQCGFNRTEGLWEWRRTCEGGKPLLEKTNQNKKQQQKNPLQILLWM